MVYPLYMRETTSSKSVPDRLPYLIQDVSGFAKILLNYVDT